MNLFKFFFFLSNLFNTPCQLKLFQVHHSGVSREQSGTGISELGLSSPDVALSVQYQL